MATMSSARIEKYLFIYVVDRDFGFAPNPFHGLCSLATCKPRIRNSASEGDWIIGVGGKRLQAKDKCVFLMKITETLKYDEYWSKPRFLIKRPLRNGSLVMMVGDNVYHKGVDGNWIQEDSHHSNSDGTINQKNLMRDTSSENVLLSNHFYYFGKAAPLVDLDSIGYKNTIGYSKKSLSDKKISRFIQQLEKANTSKLNTVVADPFDFADAVKRVDQVTRKIT